MRAESGFKGDVAAGLEGLRDCEGVRRLCAVLGRQGVQSPPNSNEFLGLEGAVDAAGSSRYGGICGSI
jgi:hypothetical protein